LFSKRTGVPVQVILDLNLLEKIIPLKSGMVVYIPPKGKFVLDTYDKTSIKKASLKHKKKSFTKKRKSNTGVKKVSVKYRKKNLKPSSKKT
jgi:hypothetical protein